MKQHQAAALKRFLKNKLYSIITIAGLMIGVSVALFIGFWIAEEISIKTITRSNHLITNSPQPLHQNITHQNIVPIALSEELRISFGTSFELVVLTSKNDTDLLTTINKKISSSEISLVTDKKLLGARH
jgi:putative ABC transport system permease protein